eukprot:4762354-Pleurochrysis_carterae.AAC.2
MHSIETPAARKRDRFCDPSIKHADCSSRTDPTHCWFSRRSESDIVCRHQTVARPFVQATCMHAATKYMVNAMPYRRA